MCINNVNTQAKTVVGKKFRLTEGTVKILVVVTRI